MITNISSSVEHFPLLSTEDALSRCLLSYANDTRQRTDQKITQYSRTIAKICITTCSFIGNTSFLALNFVLPLNEGFEDVCAASNLTVMTLLSLWAGNSIINEVLCHHTPQEELITEKKIKGWKKAALYTTLLGLSLLSQLPYIYSAVKYNPGPYAVLFGFTVATGGCLIPLRSMQLDVEKQMQIKSGEQFDRTLFLKQTNYVKSVLAKRDEFIKSSPEMKETFIVTLNRIRGQQNSDTKLHDYFSHMSSQTLNSSLDSIQHEATPLSIRSARITGMILTCFYQWFIGMYTWEQTKSQVSDRNAIAGILSFLVVASTFRIMLNAITESTEEIFDSTFNSSQSQEPGSLADQFYEKRSLVTLNIVSAGVNSLALLVSYVMFKDLFKNRSAEKFAECVMCCSTFLLYQKASSDTLKGALEELKMFTGSEFEKETIKTVHEFQDLARFIETISPRYFEEFLSIVFHPQIIVNIEMTSVSSTHRQHEELVFDGVALL